jgi:hypothetical protein
VDDIGALPAPPVTSRLPEPATNLLLSVSEVTVAYPDPPASVTELGPTNLIWLAPAPRVTEAALLLPSTKVSPPTV